MIVMKDTQLVIVVLNMIIVEKTEIKRTDKAIVIGFMFLIVMMDTTIINLAMFLYSYDLQNHCSLNF